MAHQQGGGRVWRDERWYIFGPSPRWEMGDGKIVTSPRGRWEMVIVDGGIGEVGDGNLLADLPGGRWEMAKIYLISQAGDGR